MKKGFLIISGIVLFAAAAGYYFYEIHFPDVVADAIVSDRTPQYLPEKMQRRIESIRQPLHAGTETVVRQLHESGIPVEDAVVAIEGLSEENAYAILDDLTRSTLHNKDEVFNTIKKHIDADFDLEIFRESFRQHADMKVIRKAVSYGQAHRSKPMLDVNTVKAILIKALREKERTLALRQQRGQDKTP